MHPAFSYSCITLDKIRDMAKKKHRGHYCKICVEYKSNESFSVLFLPLFGSSLRPAPVVY